MKNQPVYSLVRADGKASFECVNEKSRLEVGRWYTAEELGLFGEKPNSKWQFRKYANINEWAAKVL